MVCSDSTFRKWRSYTFNEESFIHAAEKERQLLIRNSRLRDYWLAGRITIRDYLTPCEHKRVWEGTSRHLRRSGLCLFWVRESVDTPRFATYDYLDDTLTYRFHYHLIILTLPNIQQYDIRPIIKQAISVPNEVFLEPIDNTINYCSYIMKARIKGRNENDRHKEKRELFPKCGLRKIGYIGRFWGKSKKELWAEAIEEAKERAKKWQKEAGSYERSSN